ncbi:hypothetical protein Ciccas_010542 [Cichlidogyrus casuarinus]|uniref:Uncharacterized protein n=1 Tax=Cichlidogyrus casuarinus TaxID=1844966 RepID=A0ABD2PYG3_9PLAT
MIDADPCALTVAVDPTIWVATSATDGVDTVPDGVDTVPDGVASAPDGVATEPDGEAGATAAAAPFNTDVDPVSTTVAGANPPTTFDHDERISPFL